MDLSLIPLQTESLKAFRSDDRSAWDPPSQRQSRICVGYSFSLFNSMRKKQPVPFAQKFPNADPIARGLAERLIQGIG
ncbi:hypothetical protein RJT34_28394 [Clitoria ternatea]|uniref:Uncharacterized protein n=1 Tax=Clitoria ternatea TaxID=43366 RepID=A0AAN9FDM9_CLITE